MEYSLGDGFIFQSAEVRKCCVFPFLFFIFNVFQIFIAGGAELGHLTLIYLQNRLPMKMHLSSIEYKQMYFTQCVLVDGFQFRPTMCASAVGAALIV